MEQGAEIIAASPVDETETAFQVAWLEPRPPEFRDYVVPNEECDIAQDTRDLDEDGVYIGFRSAKTLSELAQMGFETEGLSDEGYSGTSDILANARNGSRVDMWDGFRSEEHTSELQSLMRISYAVFCLKKKNISSKE